MRLRKWIRTNCSAAWGRRSFRRACCRREGLRSRRAGTSDLICDCRFPIADCKTTSGGPSRATPAAFFCAAVRFFSGQVVEEDAGGDGDVQGVGAVVHLDRDAAGAEVEVARFQTL